MKEILRKARKEPGFWLGLTAVIIAMAFAAVMGYFPKGFVEPITPESFLASTPHMHAVIMFAMAYLMIAMLAIGGALAVRREMFMARRYPC